jgi:3-hydroxyacyl-CoA dehydrogenase/3-hydroxy-2-methylbutyryl-CoA dehydrogenase
MALASRVALITGAASGLGKATALRLAKQGAKVAIIDLPHQPGADVAKAIGSGAIFCPADVTKEDEASSDIILARHSLYCIQSTLPCCAGQADPRPNLPVLRKSECGYSMRWNRYSHQGTQ